MEKKLEVMDRKIMAMNKVLEDSIVHLEMERVAFYLRFQNVAEAKDEDLGVIMSELIAEALQRDWQEIVNELDEVYRIHTNYARRHKLPREVHIRFVRKKVRDIIYKIIKKESMLYKDKEIVTLKQIPR
uniref:L1 transposable element RRM domain-containing protein n=1 Tax=Micrurus carvalhoi TaxID=3147026 RepID=A0A2H6MY49_9SAUR